MLSVSIWNFILQSFSNKFWNCFTFLACEQGKLHVGKLNLKYHSSSLVLFCFKTTWTFSVLFFLDKNCNIFEGISLISVLIVACLVFTLGIGSLWTCIYGDSSNCSGKQIIDVYVVVQFCPWFKLYFALSLGMVMCDIEFKTKENKIEDKIEPQHYTCRVYNLHYIRMSAYWKLTN